MQIAQPESQIAFSADLFNLFIGIINWHK